MSAQTPPRFGIVGWKNAGKTTLTARLVTELTGRGHRIATLKHAHSSFDIDHQGTDSHAHRMAGATEVAIVSPTRWAIMHENMAGEPEATLDQIIARLSPCDLVLIEGFKRATHPKIEVRLAADDQSPWLCDTDPSIIALVYDQLDAPGPETLPRFSRDAITEMADLIETSAALALRPQRDAAKTRMVR